MCGGHADEPVASYREGDVVRVRSPEHAIFEERIGRVGACDAAFGLRLDWPRGEDKTPVWIPWAAFTSLDLAASFKMRLVANDLFPKEDAAAPPAYVTLGLGWLRAPVVLRAAAPPRGARKRARSPAARSPEATRARRGAGPRD